MVIDNTARSPKGTGKGGTAMYPSLDLVITMRKARTMTWKQVFCVPIGEKSPYDPWGGAKGGIVYDSSAPDAEEVLRAWARALASYEVEPGKFVIPDKYIFGLDVGLKEWATKAVVNELGNNQKVSTGKPVDCGGIPYDELGVTGLGLVESIKTTCLYAGVNFEKATVAIQGFGAVGGGVVRWLTKLKKRPRVVAVSDWKGTIYNPGGLKLGKLIRVCKETGSVINYKDAEKIPLGQELFLPVDILILAYHEDQIDMSNVGQVRAKIVSQGANLGVTREAEEYLHRNGILSLPDFVVNCGASTIVYVEHACGTIKEGLTLVRKVIPKNTRLIIEKSISQGKSPREVAQKIAEEEVLKAAESKRELGKLQ